MAGGARPGAGRKPGGVNRLTAESVARAKETGELPLDFLLRVMRGESIGKEAPSLAQRIDAAKAAAPYTAPRLSAIELERSNGQTASIHSLSDEELMELAMRGVVERATPAPPR